MKLRTIHPFNLNGMHGAGHSKFILSTEKQFIRWL